MLKKCGRPDCNEFQLDLAPMAIEKLKILVAVLEIPAKQHCQFSPFGPIFEVNGLDWQCYLAGSSKTAPRILIFSIAIDADYSYQVKNSEIWAPAFFKHNNSFIATVSIMCPFNLLLTIQKIRLENDFYLCQLIRNMN